MSVDVRSTGAPELRIVAADDDTILNLDPLQGLWTEAQYLRRTDGSRRLLEFVDGCMEVLPMPTERDQVISRFVFLALFALTQRLGGTVLYAPLRLQIRKGKFREPELLLVRDERDPRGQNAYWLGADLVVEIISPDDPERDTKVKRADYDEAGISEYWIVDPVNSTVTVLGLNGAEYAEHGVFGRGEDASSALLADFSVPVNEVLDAE